MFKKLKALFTKKSTYVNVFARFESDHKLICAMYRLNGVECKIWRVYLDLKRDYNPVKPNLNMLTPLSLDLLAIIQEPHTMRRDYHLMSFMTVLGDFRPYDFRKTLA